jgi:hypothetical protein
MPPAEVAEEAKEIAIRVDDDELPIAASSSPCRYQRSSSGTWMVAPALDACA